MHNVLNVPIMGEDGQTPAREFRVTRIDRYQVTDWEAFNGPRTRVLAENLTLKQANDIAIACGLACPGALVNVMDMPHEGGLLYLDEHGEGSAPLLLQALPYAVAAAIKQAAIVAGSNALLRLLDEAKVAVDVKGPPQYVVRIPEVTTEELESFKSAWSRAARTAAAEDAGEEASVAKCIEKGCISHAAVMAWVRSWGSEDDLPHSKDAAAAAALAAAANAQVAAQNAATHAAAAAAAAAAANLHHEAPPPVVTTA